MSNVDQFVDAVYDELEKIFAKDKNVQKQMLGNSPITKLFDVYSDWMTNNLGLTPRIAANAIYRDAIGVNYFDFPNRKLKKGVQIQGQPGMNLIYGNQKEIDQATSMMNQIKATNPQRHQVLSNALQKVKALSDTIKPVKNIFGKITAQSKSDVSSFKLPTMQTFQLFMKMNDKQLADYIKQLDKAKK